MGSHLGASTGGKIVNGDLICPFHGFRYDVSGQCVATPHAPPPKNAKLTVFETRIHHGMLFAWHSNAKQPANFDLPEIDEDDGWSQLAVTVLKTNTHPEYIAENAVDLAHLEYVHFYDDVEPISVTVNGAVLNSEFKFKRKFMPRLDRFVKSANVSSLARVHGLGYSLVEYTEHTIPFQACLWVLAVPVDEKNLDLYLVSKAKLPNPAKRKLISLAFLPRSLRREVVNWILLSQYKKDVEQDITIWDRKILRHPPALLNNEREIATYRRYVQQFYPITRSSDESEANIVGQNKQIVQSNGNFGR